MPAHQFTTPPSPRGYRKGCRCIDCQTAYKAMRRAYRERTRDRPPANPESLRASYSRYNHSKKGIARRRKHVPRQRQWWLENPEKSQQYREKYRANGQYAQAQLRYSQTEHGRKVRKATYFARQARKHQAQGSASVEQIDARWAFYGNRCYLCGAPATDTDHVIPLSKGGSAWPANLRPACRSCNLKKSNMSLAEYLARRCAE